MNIDSIQEQRAKNIIWNAAGDYHFVPDYAAYEKDGVYYLIFDYPAVPKRFKRILHEYGVRCGDNIFAANLRENAQEICRSNAIAVIGKCL